MIDSLVPVAFSVQANKGVYALLLGSGISRSAAIPTGWEVVLNLIGRLAAASGNEPGVDPAAWYRDQCGREANYAELLDAVARTPSERQSLMRSFFEPTDEERKQGLKAPTPAHRAIARLVRQGYVRVIVTTNFDRLLERAIQDEGVEPTVLSSPDLVEGAGPLIHQPCCVIKVHGDYHDTRIRNTPAELAAYDPRMDRLLAQVFDEFGLIVAGWSAAYDTALRAAIERVAARRYPMYWAAKGDLTSQAARLVEHRRGVAIPIEEADSFFPRLADMVESIDRSRRASPATLQALEALMKRYLAEPGPHIGLSDLVHEETEAARTQIAAFQTGWIKARPVAEPAEVFERSRALVARLQTVLMLGCCWGRSSEHRALWIGMIDRLCQPLQGDRPPDWVGLYPSMVLVYAGALSALSAGQYDCVVDLLTKPSIREHGRRIPWLQAPHWQELHDPMKSIPELEKQLTPRSDHLFQVLREPLRRYVPDDDRYAEVFDEFEHLVALLYLNADTADRALGDWVPRGRFFWNRRPGSWFAEFPKLIGERGSDWPPFQTKVFGPKLARIDELQRRLDALVSRAGMY